MHKHLFLLLSLQALIDYPTKSIPNKCPADSVAWGHQATCSEDEKTDLHAWRASALHDNPLPTGAPGRSPVQKPHILCCHLKTCFTNIIHNTCKQHRGKADHWCQSSAQEGSCCGGTEGQLRPCLLQSWEHRIQRVHDSCPNSALLLCSPPQSTRSPPAQVSSSHRLVYSDLHINIHKQKRTQ